MQPIPLHALVPDPDNLRRSMPADEFERLVESVRERGLLLPLRVKPADAAGRHAIVSGHRRHAALVVLGATHADCIVVDGPLDEATILAEQLAENLLRENLNPIEEAEGYRRYIALKKIPAAKAAQELHVPPSRLSRLLPLLDLPDDVVRGIARGTIPQETGYYLTRLPEGEERRQLVALACEGKLGRDEAARAAKASRAAPAEAASVSRITCKLAGGRSLTVAAESVQLALLIDTLEEVLRESRKARQQGLDITTLAKVFRDKAAAGGAA